MCWGAAFLLSAAFAGAALVASLAALVGPRHGAQCRVCSRGIVGLILGGLSLLGLVAGLVFDVPAARDTYKDFQVALPRITEVLIEASNTCLGYPYVVLPLVAGPMVVVLVVPLVLKNRWALFGQVMIDLWMASLSILAWRVLSLPMHKLMSSLSEGSSGT